MNPESPAVENAILARLDPDSRAAAFLRLWTRKEAALKAWGTGIGEVPLPDVEAEAEALHGDRLPGGAGLPPLRLQTLELGELVLSVAAVSDAPFEVLLAS